MAKENLSETLILVDSKDKEIGFEEKPACHKWPCKLHRAFSIFIVNSKGELLIHVRSRGKATWPEKYWTNACCSHPRKGESLEEATQRRLKDELGFTVPLQELFSFEYKAQYDLVWGEHEFDHVFLGNFDGHVVPNPAEVKEWKWASPAFLLKDMKDNPGSYTPWFKIALPRVLQHMKK